MITRLTVLYDAECGFCCRCRDWLLRQEQFLYLELFSKDGSVARAMYPELQWDDSDELVVIDDEGGVYRGPSAFLMCLYALVDYRAWSFRLAAPALLPLARKGFELVSTRRHLINEWLGLESDGDVAAHLDQAVGAGAPRCVTTGNNGS